jgi:hypothetical protein
MEGEERWLSLATCFLMVPAVGPISGGCGVEDKLWFAPALSSIAPFVHTNLESGHRLGVSSRLPQLVLTLLFSFNAWACMFTFLLNLPLPCPLTTILSPTPSSSQSLPPFSPSPSLPQDSRMLNTSIVSPTSVLAQKNKTLCHPLVSYPALGHRLPLCPSIHQCPTSPHTLRLSPVLNPISSYPPWMTRLFSRRPTNMTTAMRPVTSPLLRHPKCWTRPFVGEAVKVRHGPSFPPV